MKGSEELEKFQISLAAARVNAEMTQEEVAKAMGVTKQTVVNWEKSRTEIDHSQAKKLSKLYNMPLNNIFFGK